MRALIARSWTRRLAPSLWGLCAFLFARSALADPQACFDAALEGQKLERQGRLLAARTVFRSCAAETCPKEVTRQCTEWLAKVEESIATVVIHAQDDKGRDIPDATVSIDGRLEPGALSGRALVLDPGPHTVRWERAQSAPVETSVILHAGEKGRAIAATLLSPRDETPIAAYAIGGAGVVALGVFAWFGFHGFADRRSFGCDVACSSDQASTVRREFVVADVSLGVSALLMGAAVWRFLASSAGEPPAPTSTEPGEPRALQSGP
jgi:hypothetical protein